MILRFVGLVNAAIWLGAVVVLALGVGPAIMSPDVEHLLGTRNFPYFSGAIAQIAAGRCMYFQFACGLVALLHVLAEWLYFGRAPKRRWLGLLTGLISLSLVSGCLIQPELKRLHALQFTAVEQRAAASRAFRTWDRGAAAANLLMISGLVLYLWRVANPSDPTRTLPAAKFRG